MPVDTKHPDYLLYSDRWLRAREVISGEDAVKQAGERYLPKLGGDAEDEYKAYKDRSDFFNATGRTLAGFKGMAFRKPMALEFDDTLKPLERDATMSGSSLQDYGKKLLDELLAVGRAGTLVDFTAEEGGGRPYFTAYRAEQIINWQMGRVAGRNVLKLVVLDEMAEIDDLPAQEQSAGDAATEAAAAQQAEGEADEFAPAMVRQLRVLRLETLMEPVGYVVEIYRETTKDNKTEWAVVATVKPTRRSKMLDFIPFVFHTASNCGCECERPPLDDIILKNLAHWRNSADYEHGLHFTATPTPWVTGVEPTGDLNIGSGIAWEIANAEAKVGMLEFTGNGLGTIKEAMEQKEHHMAVLGAKMLEAAKRATETAETWRIKSAGEATTLTDWVTSLSESLTTAARMAAWWIAPADKKLEELDAVKVTVNTEFITMTLTPDEIRALVIAFQSQTMSRTTVIANFAKGGLLPQGTSPDDESALIDSQPPPAGFIEQPPPAAPGTKPKPAKGAAK